MSVRSDRRWHMARLVACAVASCAIAIPAFAQTASPPIATGAWPQRPVRLVVAFAPGGPADIVGRILAQSLQATLGQSVVVENRAGAGGNIATRYVAREPADGYTLLVNTSSMAVNQTLFKEPGYDLLTDLSAIGLVAASPNILVVPMSEPSNTLREFFSRYTGRKLSYGSAGIGSTPHLTGDHVLRVLGGLDAVHVPYQGAAPALTAAMAAQVEVSSIALPPAVAQIKAGKVKGLAVTSLKRLESLPDVPTVAEAGFPDFEDYTWVGLFAPAKLPADIVERLNAGIDQMVRQTDMRDRLAAAGMEPLPGTPAQFTAYLGKEVAKWRDIIKQTGVTPQ